MKNIYLHASHFASKIGLILSLACIVFLMHPTASAYAADSPSVFSDNCTILQVFNTQAAKLTPTIQAVIIIINEAVNLAMENLYNGIVDSDGYESAVGAAVAVYLTFYAIAFMFGIVPLTMQDAVMRVIKMVIVLTLITDGWDYYEETFVAIFRDGGEYLVEEVSALTPPSVQWFSFSLGSIDIGWGAGGVNVSITDGVAAPIAIFQNIIGAALSPRMFILIYAAFGSGPFGVPMGLIMIFAVIQILEMIIKAVEVYGLSLVVKAILLGLGPIFLVFILFERTKPFFTSWINQLISFTLQPIFMFAFLAFYIGMLESAIWDMVPSTAYAVAQALDGQVVIPIEACFNRADTTQGGQMDNSSWRYNIAGVYPFQGQYNFKGIVNYSTILAALGVNPNHIPVFPVTIISTLIVLILAAVGKQLVMSATSLASELASGGVSLVEAVSKSADKVIDGLKG